MRENEEKLKLKMQINGEKKKTEEVSAQSPELTFKRTKFILLLLFKLKK